MPIFYNIGKLICYISTRQETEAKPAVAVLRRWPDSRLLNAGIQSVVGNDIDEACRYPYDQNNQHELMPKEHGRYLNRIVRALEI